MSEFKLSDAIVGIEEVYKKDKVIHIQNVKEFIKLLKDGLENGMMSEIETFEFIDKLAGDELK